MRAIKHGVSAGPKVWGPQGRSVRIGGAIPSLSGTILRRLAVMGLACGVAACQTVPPAPACPVGQEQVRTAELFLGQKNVGPAPNAAAIQRFIDEEITPRFPEGVTVIEGGAQWQGQENGLVREAAKIVLIVLPPKRDPGRRLEAVRKAYRQRFQQESVLVVTQPACVAL